MHIPVFLATPGPVLHFDVDFFLNFVFRPSTALIGGLAITIYASVISQAVGVILGTFSALAGTRDVTLGFISLRGAVLAGIVALSVNEGAYMSEIVRAGILSVDPGQTEAAKSLGMTYGLTMRRIVLPQALRVIIPPLGNEFNNMLKTTSLMSIIAVEEIFRVAQAANSATFKSFEAFLGVALYYLLLTTIWSTIQGAVERRLGVSSSREEQPGLRARLFGLANRSANQVGRGG